MEILSADQKRKLDEAAAYHKFKNSVIGQVLTGVLQGYRADAIRSIESDAHPAILMEGVRRLHAANHLIRHIEAEIETKVSQVEDVADELGVDLDELRIRRDIAHE